MTRAADEAGDPVPVVRLEPWSGPWPDDDPDANFKADVALYARLDPLETVRNLAAHLGVPEGAIVRYVLARWATAGSGGRSSWARRSSTACGTRSRRPRPRGPTRPVWPPTSSCAR